MTKKPKQAPPQTTTRLSNTETDVHQHARLREQYRDALEAERRASARRKNAKDAVDHYADQLVRSRRHVPFNEEAYLDLTRELGDKLEAFRARDEDAKAAKKDLKAAANAYLATVDEVA